MYFGGNNHGCQEYSKNLYKYTQADRLKSKVGGGGGGGSSRTQCENIRRFFKKSVFFVDNAISKGGGVVTETSKKTSVDSAINNFLSVD